MNENKQHESLTIEDKQFELNKQLHEQYATNVNANTSSFISFIVALFVLFGFFGYVFIFSDENNIDSYSATRLPITAFYIISIVTSIVLCFLSVITVDLGYSQRRDHIVIDKIRDVYYNGSNKTKKDEDDDKNQDMKRVIFGDSYNPKGKNWYSYLPGYYNAFWWLFIIAQIVVIFIVAMKLDVAWSRSLVLIIFPFLTFLYRTHKFTKYKEQ